MWLGKRPIRLFPPTVVVIGKDAPRREIRHCVVHRYVPQNRAIRFSVTEQRMHPVRNDDACIALADYAAGAVSHYWSDEMVALRPFDQQLPFQEVFIRQAV